MCVRIRLEYNAISAGKRFLLDDMEMNAVLMLHLGYMFLGKLFSSFIQ